MEKDNKFYSKSVAETMAALDSSAHGLSKDEAMARLVTFGRNKLAEKKKKSLFMMFLMQFANAMTIILVAAAVISGAFGEITDTLIIAAVVLLNAILGVVQESKAEKAVEALQKLSSQKAKVRRQTNVITVDSDELVPGDIVLLEAGSNVPADIRLIDCHSLKIEEAALTGESVPSEKNLDALIKTDAGIGDRHNMAYMGTNVTYGRGEGVVVATGMNTEMGAIAAILNSTKEEQTPLQKQMNKLGKMLSIGVLAICAIIFAVNLIRNGTEKESLIDSFLKAVSLAVAAIPEGLTTVVTLIMSLGVTRMSKRNAIIRKLPAIETLGCAEVICSDKTGTLTQNKMKVVETFALDPSKVTENKLLLVGNLCNDSEVEGDHLLGDPTETALVEYAKGLGLNKTDCDIKYKRVNEVPFDSVRKLMSTVNRSDSGELTMFVKGATEELLIKCSRAFIDGQVIQLTEHHRRMILENNTRMTRNALRVLGFAYKQGDGLDRAVTEKDEKELIFVGLMGMIDPVRPEVKGAIAKCLKAGITPIMITGDHKVTAIAIGKELGMIKDDSEAITGKELDAMSDEQFRSNLSKFKIYARVSPENKVRIVKFWKERGKVVAMTGDGVNDAPALKTANIGVGMGITGTDVTKNVADVVLADDNFNTIVIAVEEGRVIYSNIRKTIQFLLSSNICEVLAIFIATLILPKGLEILAPVQILWVNLVTDTLPALGLGLERPERDIMSQPPRSAKAGLFSDGVAANIIYQSIYLTGLVLAAYFIGYKALGNAAYGQTMAFAVLSLSQIAHSFNLKSAKNTVFNKNIFNNKVLTFGALAVFALIFLMIYIPGLNGIFHLTQLPVHAALIVVALSVAIIPLVEISKVIVNAIRNVD